MTIWSCGVTAIALWQLIGWTMLHRLRRDSTSAPDDWSRTLHNLADRMHVSRARLLVSSRIDVPVVIGLLRPIVLVPISLLGQLSPAHVQAILAHELAHLRRHDYLVNLIHIAIETLLFYHPAVWWMSKQLRHERECACDEIAAKVCGSRINYAQALASLELRRSPLLATCATGSGKVSDMSRRIRRLLVQRDGAKATWPTAILFLSCVAIVVLLAVPKARLQAQTTKTAKGMPIDDTEASSITPADLEPNGEFKISPNDYLALRINDGSGAAPETAQNVRVNDAGSIDLLILGSVRCAGLTLDEFEESLRSICQKRNLVAKPEVSVNLLESPSYTFELRGAAQKTGKQALLRRDLRLLDVMFTGGADFERAMIQIYRAARDDQPSRSIEIFGQDLATSVAKLNIVIRPGDVISVTPIVGEYFLGGEVARVGVYSLTARKISVKQAIISAGMTSDKTSEMMVTIARSRDGKTKSIEVGRLSDLFDGKVNDLYLRPDDQIMVKKIEPAAATQPK